MASNRSQGPNFKDLQLESMKPQVDKGKCIVLAKYLDDDSTLPQNPEPSTSGCSSEQLTVIGNFIGKARLEYFSAVWDKNADWLRDQFQTYFESQKKEQPRPLTLKDLPKANVVYAGMIETGVVVSAKNPSEFYIVLEKASYYGLEESEWNNVLPEFQTGPEAFSGIQSLLNFFYTSYEALGIGSKDSFGPPEVGRLVAVKMVRKPTEDSVDKEMTLFQFRRGVVTSTGFDSESQSTLYTVYLLDFGWEIIVSDYFLHPLLKPFNLIPPLAVRCGLFGISPAGDHWTGILCRYFKIKLLQCEKATLSFEFCSFVTESISVSNLPSTLSYLVSIDVRRYNLKTETTEQLYNFAEGLIKNNYGIPWNLTPTRPKVMAGTTIAKLVEKNRLPKIERVVLTLRLGLLLTPHHPRLYNPLPQTVLKREVERLFRLRSHALCDVKGMDNRLMILLPDENNRLGNPASVTISYDKTCAIFATGEEMEETEEEEKAGEQEEGKKDQ